MASAKQERTKVVVRNLPPTLTEESFCAAVDKVAEGRYDWMAYYPGKVSLKRTLHSRGYLNLLTPADVLAFKERFDGHVFVSSKGSQYRCSVEYAPFQRVPKPPAKKPAMEGTIESDPAYQAFLKRLEEGPQSLPSATAQLEAREAEGRAATDGSEGNTVVVTPLMEYLRKKYAGGAPLRRGAAKGRARPVHRLDVVEELVTAPQAPEPPAPVDAKARKGRAAKAAVGKGVAADTGEAASGLVLAQAPAKHGQASKKDARRQQQQQQQQQQDAASSGNQLPAKGGRQGGATAAAKLSGHGAADAREAADLGGRPTRTPKQASAEQHSARQTATAQAPSASPSIKGSTRARPASAATSSAGNRQDRAAAAAAAAAASASAATPVLLAGRSSAAALAEGSPAPAARWAAAAAAMAASTASGADASTDAVAARRPRAVAAGGPRNRLFASALQKAAGGPAGGKAGSRQQSGNDEKSGQG